MFLISIVSSLQTPSSSSKSITNLLTFSQAWYSSSSMSSCSRPSLLCPNFLHRFVFPLAISSLSSVLSFILLFSSFESLLSPYLFFFSLLTAILSLFSSSLILVHSSILLHLHSSSLPLKKSRLVLRSV